MRHSINTSRHIINLIQLFFYSTPSVPKYLSQLVILQKQPRFFPYSTRTPDSSLSLSSPHSLSSPLSAIASPSPSPAAGLLSATPLPSPLHHRPTSSSQISPLPLPLRHIAAGNFASVFHQKWNLLFQAGDESPDLASARRDLLRAAARRQAGGVGAALPAPAELQRRRQRAGTGAAPAGGVGVRRRHRHRQAGVEEVVEEEGAGEGPLARLRRRRVLPGAGGCRGGSRREEAGDGGGGPELRGQARHDVNRGYFLTLLHVPPHGSGAHGEDASALANSLGFLSKAWKPEVQRYQIMPPPHIQVTMNLMIIRNPVIVNLLSLADFQTLTNLVTRRSTINYWIALDHDA
ncbi:hypothetical protein ZWY2020_003738 [Hordeum vulgare]|nr:hypothetical protein ZWY2020_003738 [Hordeum vulgare]